MLTVGLTGGIGSGKSTVADLLAELGAVVIDADQVARDVVEPGTPTLAAIAARFGEHLIRADGSLDRAGLAAVAFPDPVALADLNAITGPAISARVAQLRAGIDPGTITVYDMPLLVERRLWPHEHLTIVVGADEPVRVRRLVGRGLSEEDARHRMAAQASDAERHAAADVWIDNNGLREATLTQVRRLWETRLVPFNANLLSRTSPHGPTEVVEPDPTWPVQAARLAARIEYVLGGRGAVTHIGPASDAGPVPDVIALEARSVVAGGLDETWLSTALEVAGYFPVAGRPGDYASADPSRAARVTCAADEPRGWSSQPNQETER